MTKAPHPVDVKVGQTVLKLRRLRGISQQELAAKIGVSFQQLQKYERGTNRISASRMYELARALHVKPGDLFEGQGGDIPELPIFADRNMAKLIDMFARIKNPEKHKAILKLVEVIADTDEAERA